MDTRVLVNKNVLTNQYELIEKMLSYDLISLEDIHNLYTNAECDEHQEILSWWLITDWLGIRLIKRGEPVLANEYGTWWGRTTYGQLIEDDTVIEDIAKELANE